MNEVIVILPPKATTKIDLDLVNLTEYLIKTKKLLRTGGLLGGKFGYGVEFENDVFMMHPYCWCEKETCPWCFEGEFNFLHKQTGLGITWYKWIGRSMNVDKELKNPETWNKIYQEVIESLI